jgi:hypothetical protein
MIEHIGPVIEKIVESVGEKAATAGLMKLFKKLTKKADVDLAPKEIKQLEKEVEKLVRVATFEEVKQFDPKYRMIANRVQKSATKRVAAKKAAKKAVWKSPARKASPRKAPAKKTAAKKAPAKKAPKR